MDKTFKAFVIGALVFLTLIIVAGASMVFYIFTTTQNAAKDGKDTPAKQEQLVIVKLEEPINSNLKIAEDNIPHIVRIDIGIELNSKAKDYKEVSAMLTSNQIVIRDKIISIVRNHTYGEINKEGLSKEIKEQISTLLNTDSITNIYFGDFFVQ